ncbi:MAG: replicative DNA helicase [Candidatus Binatia bacterium]
MNHPRRSCHRQGDGPPSTATLSPPGDIEIERMLLMALVIDNSLIPEIVPALSVEEFYGPSSQEVYRGILKLWSKGEPVNLATLSQITDQYSASEIASWGQNCLPSSAPSYVQIVKKAAFARCLLAVLQQAQEGIYTRSSNIETVMATLINNLVRLKMDNRTSDFEPIRKAIVAGMKMIERAMAGEIWIRTGFADYDRRIGGLQPGELVVVAGRPGMGKTAFAQTIAMNVAKLGVCVAFVSVEMPASQIAVRLLAGETKIENRDLRRGHIDDHQSREIIRSASNVDSLPLWILDSDRSWSRLEAKIRALKLREPNLGLVILDYAGLIKVSGEQERYRELGVISSGAKQLAMELNLNFILCSQLNRNAENRPNTRPQLADLRESGDLEQDADIVILLFRPAFYDETYRPWDLAYADVCKNRNGSCGALKLKFDERTVSFRDWMDPEPVVRDITETEGGH